MRLTRLIDTMVAGHVIVHGLVETFGMEFPG